MRSVTLLTVLWAALILALLAWAAKEAAAYPATTNPVTVAVERAEAYWDVVPCDGQVQVAMGEPEPHHAVEGTTVMWATFYQGDPDTDCTVHLNPRLWPTWQTDDASFGEFCQAMVYEFGHFLGHRDEGEHPGEAFLLGPAVPQCRHWSLRYGRTIFTQDGQLLHSGR
jgi:hypothetical protein